MLNLLYLLLFPYMVYVSKNSWIICREEEPLFKAISDGDVRRVKALMLDPGTNLMLPSKPGWLAIHQAAWFGQHTCLKVLLSGKYIHRVYSQTHRIRVQSKTVICCSLLSSAWNDQQENRSRWVGATRCHQQRQTEKCSSVAGKRSWPWYHQLWQRDSTLQR